MLLDRTAVLDGTCARRSSRMSRPAGASWTSPTCGWAGRRCRCRRCRRLPHRAGGRRWRSARGRRGCRGVGGPCASAAAPPGEGRRVGRVRPSAAARRALGVADGDGSPVVVRARTRFHPIARHGPAGGGPRRARRRAWPSVDGLDHRPRAAPPCRRARIAAPPIDRSARLTGRLRRPRPGLCRAPPHVPQPRSPRARRPPADQQP